MRAKSRTEEIDGVEYGVTEFEIDVPGYEDLMLKGQIDTTYYPAVGIECKRFQVLGYVYEDWRDVTALLNDFEIKALKKLFIERYEEIYEHA